MSKSDYSNLMSEQLKDNQLNATQPEVSTLAQKSAGLTQNFLHQLKNLIIIQQLDNKLSKKATMQIKR